MESTSQTGLPPGFVEIQQLRSLGVPIAEIARRLGVSRETIYKRIKKGGTASTVSAQISNPTETQGAFTKDTTVSRDAERNG